MEKHRLIVGFTFLVVAVFSSGTKANPYIKKGTFCADPNSEWDSCGSVCPLSCDTSSELICTEQCVEGCFCKTGYVLNATSHCIPVEQCPQKLETSISDRKIRQVRCGNNEMFTPCGSACEKSCGSSDDIVCAAVCVPGCFCRQGYLRSQSGQCIPPNQC